MTIGAVIYLLIISWILFSKRSVKNIYISLLALHIFTCTNIEVGYFCKIGESILQYNIFTEIILSLFSLFLMISKRRIKGLKSILPTIISTAVGIISLLQFPLKKLIVTGETVIDSYWNRGSELAYPSFNLVCIKSLIHYLTFLLILCALSQIFTKADYIKLLKITGDWTKISVISGMIEFIFKNIFKSNSYIDTLIDVFGDNERVFMGMDQVGTLYRIIGLTTEASHFSYALFIGCILFFANYCIGQQRRKWVILSLIMMGLTTSFTSLLYYVALFVIYVIFKYKKDIKIGKNGIKILGAMVVLFFAIIIIYNTPAFQESYFGEKLQGLLNDNLLFIDITKVRNYTYTSTRIRIVSMISTLRLIVDRPLFGIGIGTTSSHGSFAAIVSGLGVIGTYCWLKALFFNAAKEKFSVCQQAYIVTIVIWCFLGLFIGMFWGMLYNAGNYTLMISWLLLLDKEQEYKSLFKSKFRYRIS